MSTRRSSPTKTRSQKSLSTEDKQRIRDIVNEILEIDDYNDNDEYRELLSKFYKFNLTSREYSEIIQLEPPEPSHNYVVKYLAKILKTFNEGKFSDVCYKITCIKVKKALMKVFREQFGGLNVYYLEIYKNGWDNDEVFLNDSNYTYFRKVFMQLADDVGMPIPPISGSMNTNDYIDEYKDADWE